MKFIIISSNARVIIPALKLKKENNPYKPLWIDKKQHKLRINYSYNYKEYETFMIYLDIMGRYVIISPFINIKKEDLVNNIDAVIDLLKKESNFDKLIEWVAENSIMVKRGELKKENAKQVIEEASKLLIKEYIDLKDEKNEKISKKNLVDSDKKVALDKE